MAQKNIAICSPNKSTYSETFIQAQKEGLEGKVYYYYGGELPTDLENFGKLFNQKDILINKIKQQLKLTGFNANEIGFIHSLKKNKIQVVIAQYGTTAYRIVEVCKYLTIPLITHFHGYDASVESVIRNCNNYKNVFEYSTYVICVSISMKENLILLGCPPEKLIYNTCAPSPSFLDIKPKFAAPTFIGLGRFVEKKAPYYTILAFSQVLKKYPDAKLVIGGNGNLYEVCKNLVQYLKIEKNVLLPGILLKEEFTEYLENSLAFVQHSVTAINGDQEGTPVAILEASAAGLPVIATLHAGIPDVILNGQTGLLVSEHNVDEMAQKMLILLEDKELAIQLGENGKNRMKSEYTMQKHLNTIDELIDKIVLSND
ncbi:glycosyltransferase [Flavobacterium piscisymbiosum]|uniref:Glycosyltransferase n=1 Tax=Flavobacterium piscisymbiosum TaxID=2893753 RepID=A0ABS8M8B9_9FLAO|nr:glycosyltransferase [Flavobacterium sp. F-30]MCC9061721.1 glycosyltransferase [Flavobacterium sp. F-30]